MPQSKDSKKDKSKSYEKQKSTSSSQLKSGSSSKPKSDKTKSKSKSKSKSKPESRSKRKKEKKDRQPGYMDVYCAIFHPPSGNYYHWSLAVLNLTSQEWIQFEVRQEHEDGPYYRDLRTVNPNTSGRFRELLPLVEIEEGWASKLMEIADEEGPDDSLEWNCQDYVMQIWGEMFKCGMMDEYVYGDGIETMMPYYGCDFGGPEPDNGQEDDHEDDEQDQGDFPSAQFISDSDDC